MFYVAYATGIDQPLAKIMPEKISGVLQHICFCFFPFGAATAPRLFYLASFAVIAGFAWYLRAWPSWPPARKRETIWLLLLILTGLASSVTSFGSFMKRYAYVSFCGSLPLLLLAVREVIDPLAQRPRWRRLPLLLFCLLLAGNFALLARTIATGRFHTPWRVGYVRELARDIAATGAPAVLVVLPDLQLDDPSTGGVVPATVDFFLPRGYRPRINLMPASQYPGDSRPVTRPLLLYGAALPPYAAGCSQPKTAIPY